MKNKELISANFHWSKEIKMNTLIMYILMCFPIYFSLAFVILPVVITVIFAGYAPTRMKLDNHRIEIKTLIGSSIKIPLRAITTIRAISPEYLNGSIRIVRSKGFMGYLGKFRHGNIGTYNMHATEIKNLILIKTTNKNYVFNYEEPDKFISLVTLLKNNKIS